MWSRTMPRSSGTHRERERERESVCVCVCVCEGEHFSCTLETSSFQCAVCVYSSFHCPFPQLPFFKHCLSGHWLPFRVPFSLAGSFVNSTRGKRRRRQSESDSTTLLPSTSMSLSLFSLSLLDLVYIHNYEHTRQLCVCV